MSVRSVFVWTLMAKLAGWVHRERFPSWEAWSSLLLLLSSSPADHFRGSKFDFHGWAGEASSLSSSHYFSCPPLLFLPLSHSSQLPQSRTYQNMKSTCFLFLVDVRQQYCFSHLSWNPIITRACVCRRARLCTQKGVCVSYDNRSEDDIMLVDQSATAPPVEAAPHYWSPPGYLCGAFKDQHLLHVYASKGKHRLDWRHHEAWDDKETCLDFCTGIEPISQDIGRNWRNVPFYVLSRRNYIIRLANVSLLWRDHLDAHTPLFSCRNPSQDNSGMPVMWETHFCRAMLVFPLTDCWEQYLKAAHDSTRLLSCDLIAQRTPDLSPQQLY